MSRANGRRDADALLAIALASGATLKDAAEQVGISLSTAKRRAADPEFMEFVDQARADIVQALRARVVHAGGRALDALERLLGSESESVQLGAARALLGAAVPREHASVARFTAKDISGLGEFFWDTLLKFIPDEQQARAASALNAAFDRKIGP
jgi:hypothetical protein